MEIRQLKYFLEVARAGSYSAAADSLFISQPALSTSIKQLEKEIGAPLFCYKNKVLQMTCVGQDFREEILPFVRQYDQITKDFCGKDQREKGNIRLGISTLLLPTYCAPIIVDFARTHPEISLHLEEEGSGSIQTMLLNNKIDIGIVIYPSPNASLTLRELPEISAENVIVCRKGHPYAGRDHISLGDMKDMQFIAPDSRFSFTEFFIRECKVHDFEPNIILTSVDKSFILDMIGRTDLMAALPSTMLSEEDRENYSVLHYGGAPYSLAIGLMHQNDYSHRVGEIFIDYFCSSVQQAANQLPEETTI